MRKGVCNGIVLHDFDVTQVDIRGLFEFIEKWFTDHGYPPNRGGYEVAGLPQSSKTKTFQHMKKSLELKNFEHISYYSLMRTLPDGFDGADFLFYAGINIREKFIEFMFDDEEFKFTNEHITELISALLKFVNPRYGYAYQKDFGLGPVYYNMGAIYGNMLPSEEEMLISKWSRHYFINKKYQTGQFRDIYPYNIISEKHLELEIEGKKLADWIAGDPRHGALTQLKENLWVWNISDENIPLVREALRPTGQVICI